MTHVLPKNIRPVRGATLRQLMLALAVTGVLAAAGIGAYVYHTQNSAAQLAARARLALDQNDPTRAIEYLQRALDHHATGDTGIALRDLMARAMMDAGREPDARAYLQQVLAEKPAHAESLSLLAQSYVNPPLRKIHEAFKPVSPAAANDIFATIDASLAELAKSPTTPPNLIAQGQLHRLHYLILTDQAQQANADLDAAQIARDDTAVAKAKQQADAVKGPAAHERDLALEKLHDALKIDPANTAAAELIAQYNYQDHDYPAALAINDQMKNAHAISEDLALTTARTLIIDDQRQPDRHLRLTDAQQVLESFLKDHPKSPRIEVSLGDVLLDLDNTDQAVKLGKQAAAEAPGDLAAQVLLINCRLKEKQPEEALRLITPLTTSHSSRAEVWHLLGITHMEMGESHSADAENALRKALAVNPGYTPARQALLTLEIRTGNAEAAALTAAQMLREDRFNMTAWQVILDAMRQRGQLDRARQLLLPLAVNSELPADAKPDLVRLLSLYGLPDAAAGLLATLPPNDKSTLTLKAYVAGASGNTIASRALVSQALAADPNNLDLRLKYTDLLAQAGLFADVRAQLDQTRAAKIPAGTDQSLQIARDYLALRLPTQAQSALQPVLLKQPKNADALALSQQAQSMLDGKPSDPSPAADNAANSSINAADAIRAASAALQQNKFPDALVAARAGLAKDKNNVALHTLAARALAGMGQPDQAVDEIVEAARLQPDVMPAYAAFVDLFSNPDAAAQAIGYGSRLESVNGAWSAWAMGRLAETAGDRTLALRDYTQGLEAATHIVDPRPAKDSLYSAILNLHAEQKDPAALTRSADAMADKDPTFSAGIHMLAGDHLLALGDRAAAQQQLELVTAKLTPASRPALTLAVATRWLSLGQSDRAIAIMDKQINASGSPAPELLDAFGTFLMQAGKLDRALEVRTTLAKADAGNPVYRVALAESQASVGDTPDAFRTLDDARAMGATGTQLANAARVRLLISNGLLNQATQELTARSSAMASEDTAAKLAVAQAWAQLGNADQARKLIETIPSYASEYVSAQLLQSGLDLEGNAPNATAAIKRLHDLLSASPISAPQIAPQLFIAYLRAGDAPNASAALQLAIQERDLYLANTPLWRNWVAYAAAAAREKAAIDGNPASYNQAITLLNSLDSDSRRNAMLDISLMQLLQSKPADAAQSAAQLPDDVPGHIRTTLLLLAGQTPDNAKLRALLTDAQPSTILATLAATPAAQRTSLLESINANPNLFPGDIDTLLKELAQSPEPSATLRQIALAQRLLEAGWSTTTLSILNTLDPSASNLTFTAIQRHQALTDLHRFSQADAIRDQIADRFKNNDQSLPPSARLVLAAAWSKQERYADALAILQPLASLNRPDLLTTLATLHEKLGQLDDAIALHRQVRKLDPDNIAAANNLAYTLAAAHPTDKAALAEARQAIQSAIDKAPQIMAFQDTLGWIEILSGNPADGTRRIARALPALRLEPAVHYHLGMGYARTGQTDLARMHLLNVAQLAHDKQTPELPLATEALRTLALNR